MALFISLIVHKGGHFSQRISLLLLLDLDMVQFCCHFHSAVRNLFPVSQQTVVVCEGHNNMSTDGVDGPRYRSEPGGRQECPKGFHCRTGKLLNADPAILVYVATCDAAEGAQLHISGHPVAQRSLTVTLKRCTFVARVAYH